MKLSKICSKCKIDKPRSDFGVRTNKRHLLQSECRRCQCERTKQYTTNNKDKVKKSSSNRYWKNRERLLQISKNYHSKHREKINKRSRERNRERVKEIVELARQRKKENPEKFRQMKRKADRKYAERHRGQINAAKARYRAAKRKAAPKWLTKVDLDYIKHLYIQAKELEKIDGVERNVDHIIPLQGETVSGLHVPWNLQILTKSENCSKRHKNYEKYI